MLIQMNGWNQVERQVRWRDEFDYVEGLLLYLLLKSTAMLKDVVPFGEIVLNLGQYVRSIHLLRRGLWFYYLKKRDLNSYSWIQHLITRLEMLGRITAEHFRMVFCLRCLVWRSLEMLECRMKRKRQIQSRNSLKTERIFFI
jgi:hypothetical protein